MVTQTLVRLPNRFIAKPPTYLGESVISCSQVIHRPKSIQIPQFGTPVFECGMRVLNFRMGQMGRMGPMKNSSIVRSIPVGNTISLPGLPRRSSAKAGQKPSRLTCNIAPQCTPQLCSALRMQAKHGYCTKCAILTFRSSVPQRLMASKLARPLDSVHPRTSLRVRISLSSPSGRTCSLHPSR
jgi:hypothetical protein